MLTVGNHILNTPLLFMRKLFLSSLLLISFSSRAQCPDPDSILHLQKGVTIIDPPIYYPYSIISSGTVYLYAWVPEVNEEPQTGKYRYFKNGLCKIYQPYNNTILLAKGHIINKKKTGKWYWYNYEQNQTTYSWTNTVSSSGEYVNGLKTGTWRIFDMNGGVS